MLKHQQDEAFFLSSFRASCEIKPPMMLNAAFIARQWQVSTSRGRHPFSETLGKERFAHTHTHKPLAGASINTAPIPNHTKGGI